MDTVYKLMIVDDEVPILSGLMSYTWEPLGFTAAAGASDGFEALAILAEQDIDVVLLDIRMPRMDGLELSDAIRKKHPDVRIVILSGHRDFEYARSAIEAQVDAYMLKPVDFATMNDTFLGVRQRLDDARARSAVNDSYRRKAEESVPLAAAAFFRAFLHRRVDVSKDIRETLALLEFDATDRFLVCLVISSDESVRAEMPSRVQNLLDDHQLGYSFSDDHDEAVAVLAFTPDSGDDGPEAALKRIVQTLVTALERNTPNWNDCSALVGVGTIESRPTLLPNSFDAARLALDNGYVGAETNVVWYRREMLTNAAVSEYPYSAAQCTIDAILAGDDSASSLHLSAFLDRIACSAVPVLRESADDYVARFLNALEQRLLQRGITLASCESGLFPLTSYVRRHARFRALAESLRQLVSCASRSVRDYQTGAQTGVSSSIAQVVRYIRANYSEPMTLETLADLVHLNPTYLSSLFRREMGRRYVDFLKECRITAAREQLADPDRMIVDVSKGVGYENPKRFAESFKKLVGVTPSEYRRGLFGV